MRARASSAWRFSSSRYPTRALFRAGEDNAARAGEGAGRSAITAPQGAAARELLRARRDARRTAVRMPRRISSGGGGQPGTATSTGITFADPAALA